MIKLGSTEYRKIHYWVERNLGKPMYCSQCHSNQSKRYHWSNISENYHYDIKDWVRLCVSCHFKKDFFKTHCPEGHKLTSSNTITRKTGYRTCRKCVLKSKKKYYYKLKEKSK